MKITRTNFRLKKALLASIAGLMLLPMAAQAACFKNGPVARVLQYDDSYSSTGCFIYMRTSPLSSVFFYARSNDDNVCTSAVSALTSQVEIGMSGNATSCPGSGSMGVVNYIYFGY